MNVLEFEVSLLPVVRAMTARGLRVDEALRRERTKALDVEAKRVEATVQQQAKELLPKLKKPGLFQDSKVCKSCRNGKKKRLSCEACKGAGRFEEWLGFNPDSTQQAADVLYNALKLPQRTNNGKLTTDEEALQSLLSFDKSGLVAAILRYRKLATMREQYERLAPAADGHIRTVFNIAGTYTGRFSSAGAFYIPHSTNLQNLTEEEAARDPLYRVRDIVIPEEGEVLIYCVGGHTRILKNDLTWEIAERIRVGDELIGFDEMGSARKFRRTVVTDNTPITQPCVRVVTDKGTVVCSRNHRWLAKRGRQTRQWLQAQDLKQGDQLPWLGYPWDVERSYDSGWLAGLFDGEGHLCDTAVGFTQKEGKGVWEQAIPLLQDRGFPLSIDRNSGGIPRANLRGLYANLRFLGQIRPKRLLLRSSAIWEGRKIWGSRSKPAFVLAIEEVEAQRVYPITTTTKTFVAEGILTHNCDLSQAEARVVACLSEDQELLRLWEDPNWDIHTWTASKLFNVPEASIGKKSSQRFRGKQSRHAFNYGEGPNKFWRTVNGKADITGFAISLAEARECFKGYHKLHPNLDVVWWNRVEQKVTSGLHDLRKGVLKNCFGFSCHFYPRFDPETGGLHPDSLRAAIAWEPQSTIGMLTNLGLLDLFRQERGQGFRVLHQTHDGVMVGADKHRVRSVARLLKKSLERTIHVNGFDLTVPAEVFVCEKRWSEAQRVL